MLKIRTYRAIDDIESCKIFAQEHAKILHKYDIAKITSFKNDWFDNPNVYVIVVETINNSEMIAGERIHLANATKPLPVEKAYWEATNKSYDLVSLHSKNKVTGELCALWSKKNMEGYGLSTLLTKIGVAVAQILNINKLFVLCAPHTVTMCQNAGFELDLSIGNNGTFIYPNPDLIATTLIIEDMGLLNEATKDFKKNIFSFIKNPIGRITTEGKKGSIEVRYNITPPNQQPKLNQTISHSFTKKEYNSYSNSPSKSFSSLPYIFTVSNKRTNIPITKTLFIKHLNEGARSPPSHIY